MASAFVAVEPRLLGAVLAGGESRRFGRDKASVSIGGEPLVTRAVRTLSSVFEEVVIVGREGFRGGESWRRLTDLRPGHGPLGGLETALALAEAEGCDGIFVLACDLPLVTSEHVRTVLACLGAADVAAPRRDGIPGCEPLCAAYRHSCLPIVRELLDRGELAVHGLIGRVDSVLTDMAAEPLLNVNTPADRARAEAILGAS